jgi:hypothetical protein
MESVGLLFKLGVLALEVFRDERGGRYSRLKKKLLKLEKEWQDEMALPDNEQSDLALDRILFNSRQLFEQIIAESGTK